MKESRVFSMRCSWMLFGLTMATVVLGAAPAFAAGPYQYHALTPCRVFDTRTAGGQTTGNPLQNPGPYNFRIQGNCGVPNGAAAVTANLTITQPTQAGDLRVFPAGSGTPAVSVLNYPVSEPALANGAIVPLATVVNPSDNDVAIVIGMGASGTVHVIFDVTGYFQ